MTKKLLDDIRAEARALAATRHLVAENDLLREVIADLSSRLKEAEQGLSQMEGLREEAKFLHARLKKAEAALRELQGHIRGSRTLDDLALLHEHVALLSTPPNQEPCPQCGGHDGSCHPAPDAPNQED